MPPSLRDITEFENNRPIVIPSNSITLVAHELWNTDNGETEDVAYMSVEEAFTRNVVLATDKEPRRWVNVAGIPGYLAS